MEKIDSAFIGYASGILADTDKGLSGSKIVSTFSKYAVEYGVVIPHAAYPYDSPNKRSAFSDNLSAFSGPQQYKIIDDIADQLISSSLRSEEFEKVKTLLRSRYSYLSENKNEFTDQIVKEAQHWLSPYPDALKVYEEGIEKFRNDIHLRNSIDDMRLALELLLKGIFGNNKSLENQISEVGKLVKDKGGSPEFVNMYQKLVEYYGKYNNANIKHGDGVIGMEVEFMIDMSSVFMKHMVKLSS